MSQGLRVLIVGYGLMGRRRLAAIEALGLPSVEIAGIVEPDGATPGQYRRWDDASQVRSILYDAAFVCVPHDVMPQLRPGVVTLREKPGAMDAASLRQIPQGPADFFGYTYRFLPHVQKALASWKDWIGAPLSAHVVCAHGSSPDDASTWKASAIRNGGVLLDLGVHAYDLLRQVCPDLQVTHVQSCPIGVANIDAHASVMLRGPQGFFADVRVSTSTWVNTFCFEVHGTEGYVICEGRGGHYGAMTLRRGRRWAWRSSGKPQRDTEDVTDFGAGDNSVEAETEAALRFWLGESVPQIPASREQAMAALQLASEARKGGLRV